ncbi:MAG: hypothetical protein PHI28_17775 [Mangrovibacterium sp.]|nr:hypothetical protein [Mangrovibacterium sp.]
MRNQTGPYEEDKRNKITGVNERSCQFISYTSRDEAFGERATNSVILELQGSPETELEISVSLPTETTYRKSLKELAASNDIFFTGGMGSGSVMIHRVVFSENYSSEFSYREQRNSDTTDWYYVRVIQANGSMAWSSPVWLNAKK